jgi:MoaA/NifB/PqqE/SkfB family radical SAM enzyme
MLFLRKKVDNLEKNRRVGFKRIYYALKLNCLGLSGYKTDFCRKKIAYGMYKRLGLRGIRRFINNFLDIQYTTSERVKTYSMFTKLDLEPTINCNLGCKMCNRTQLNGKSGNMSFDDFKKIIDKMPNLVDVKFCGLGETLFNPDILKMFEYLTSKGIIFGLVTNGILLTNKIAHKLLELNVDWIAISVDSLKRETYGLVRNADQFDCLIDNIRNLQTLKTRLRRKVFSEIVMVYMKDNKDELIDMIEFAKKNNFDGVRIKILENWDPEANIAKPNPGINEARLSETEYLPKVLAAAQKAKNYGIKFRVSREIGDLEYRRLFQNLESKCESPWYNTGVLYNGDVVPCLHEKTPHRSYVFGNILEEGFENILNSSKYREFRKRHLCGNPPDICSYCTRIIIET